MTVTLTLLSRELDNDDIQALTLDLYRKIVKNTDIDAKLSTCIFKENIKGEPITIGTIVLAFLTAGTATALLNLLKSIFIKDKTIKIIIEKDDRKFEITANNYQSEKILDLIKNLEDLT